MGLMTRWRDADLTAASVPASTPAPPIGGATSGVASPWADADYLTALTFAELYATMDALPLTRAQAMNNPAIVRGRDLICGTIARLPFYGMTGAGRMPVQPRMTSQPEVGRARFLTMLWTVDSLIFNGVAAWQVVGRYAEDARPMAVRYSAASEWERDTAGNIIRVRGQGVGPFDLIRFDGPHEGILNRSAGALRVARNLLDAYAKASRTPSPDVELHQTQGDPLQKEDRQELINGWVAARRGENGGVAYTSPSIQAIMHGKQPEDLLIAARNAVNLDAARLLNLPAWAVDGEVGGSSLTYQTVPARSRELIDYTLAPYIEAITSRLSLDDVLAAGIWCVADTNALLSDSFTVRMQGYQAAITAGIYTADECRAMELGAPVEGATA